MFSLLIEEKVEGLIEEMGRGWMLSEKEDVSGVVERWWICFVWWRAARYEVVSRDELEIRVEVVGIALTLWLVKS